MRAECALAQLSFQCFPVAHRVVRRVAVVPAVGGAWFFFLITEADATYRKKIFPSPMKDGVLMGVDLHLSNFLLEFH